MSPQQEGVALLFTFHMVAPRQPLTLIIFQLAYLELLLESLGLPPVGDFIQYLDDLLFIFDFPPADQ